MKVQNRISKQIINASVQHYNQVLSKQGWIEIQEPKSLPEPVEKKAAPKKKAARKVK